MTESQLKFIVTVTTADGSSVVHKYPVPPEHDEWKGLIENISARTVGALSTGSGRWDFAVFDNPIVRYRTDHIVKIQLDIEDPNNVVTEAERRDIGFRLGQRAE